jgi:cytochrome P450
MNMDIKTRSHWLTGYALPRAVLKLLARRGDPFAQLVIDSTEPKDTHRLVELIRQRGRISPTIGNGWVTADAQIVRDVLADGRFRTIKPRDRVPFRVVQWMLAKTDPGVLSPMQPPSLSVVDPPEHARLRRLVSQAFTPRAIDGLRHRIEEIVSALLDDLDENTECDLIADYASRIPAAILAEMLGIPDDEIPRVFAVAERITKLASPGPSWHDFRTVTAALREIEGYIAVHIERLRHDGANDTILGAVLQDGDLSDAQVRMFPGLLLNAGFVTAASAFGNAVVALAAHPDQLARLLAEPEGWLNAVEETLRYDCVVQLGARVATKTLQIDGHTVQEGSSVFLLFAGANRDPAVFDRPDEFDIARANARDHLSLGSGIHVCLGAPLARMELHIALRALFERFPQLTLVGEPNPDNSTLLHGIRHLPVNLGPARVNTD